MKALELIRERLINQDNRMTRYPLFAVQAEVLDTYVGCEDADGECWVERDSGKVSIERLPDGEDECDWDRTWYNKRFETVLTCLTQAGAEHYIQNVKDGYSGVTGYTGEFRVFVLSMAGCEELEVIRRAIMDGRFSSDPRSSDARDVVRSLSGMG